MIFLEIFNTLFNSMYHFSKSIFIGFLDCLPEIYYFINISKVFSFPYILCGILGLPLITVTIIKTFKLIIKKQSIKARY